MNKAIRFSAKGKTLNFKKNQVYKQVKFPHFGTVKVLEKLEKTLK